VITTRPFDKLRVTKVQGSRVQGFKGSRIQGFKDSRVQGAKVRSAKAKKSKVQKYRIQVANLNPLRIKATIEFLGINFKSRSYLFLDEIQHVRNLP